MKENGFTLIETIASIFILMILFSIGLTLYKFKSNLQVDMEAASYVYEIQNLLSYGKATCKEKNKYGRVTVDRINNEIRFEEGWDSIEKKILLPSEIRLFSNNPSFLIKSDGKIEQGSTIILLDKFGEKYFIKVRVGIDLISTRIGENT